MSLLPAPLDANGKLLDVGSELFSDVKTATTTAKNLQFTEDIKGFALVVRSGTLLFKGNTGISKEFFTAAAAVNAGGGKVQLTIDNCGFVSGDSVEIVGTGVAAYDTTHTLTAGTDTAKIEFAATYSVASIPATAYVKGNKWMQIPTTGGMLGPVGVEADTTIGQIKTASGTSVSDIAAWR